MSTHVAVPDSTLTARQHVQADKVANQVYSAHYSERSMAKIAIGALAGISLLLCGGLVAVSHRPVVNRYIRIDEAGRAQAIQYTDLNYSPAKVKSAPISPIGPATGTPSIARRWRRNTP